MGEFEKQIQNFYKLDEYISKNPSLHEEDSPWKVSKIIPLIDKILPGFTKKDFTILDVGGGTGLILSMVSDYIKKTYHKNVIRCALDLSPGMLNIQRNKNPDLRVSLNESIEKTSLKDKEADLILMIDVLEHLINPQQAIKEINRISSYCIFKVPLEYNLKLRAMNFLTKGRYRRDVIKKIGHINVYNKRTLEKQISEQPNKILSSTYTDIFSYWKKSPSYRKSSNITGRAINRFGSFLFRLSPSLTSYLFTDFVMILVKSI